MFFCNQHTKKEHSNKNRKRNKNKTEEGDREREILMNLIGL